MKTYKEFKKEEIDNYPSVRDSLRGSLRQLRSILEPYPEGTITFADQDELFRLIRAMNVEVTKLLAPPVSHVLSPESMCCDPHRGEELQKRR